MKTDETMPDTNPSITRKEVEEAVGNGKAAGIDNIPAELLV